MGPPALTMIATMELNGRTMNLDYCHHSSPIGELLLVGNQAGLCHIGFPKSDRRWSIRDEWQLDANRFKNARAQLDDYFAGTRRTFDLALQMIGTDFQKQVWQALQQVHYGDSLSYGEIASRIGRPKASRAVGAANGANPLPIVIPCHRIIGASGKLTGFGGGLGTKQWLLSHERGERSLFDLH